MPVWIPLAIASGISTITNLIASKHASKVAAQNTNLTIAENKKQAELAYQREQQNISEMNKYNSPSEQMKRYAEAGLNKNLVFSQGTPGNQTQLAKYQAPNIQYSYEPKFKASDFDSLRDLPMQVQQIKNLSLSGRIAEAKATMDEALSKYANLLAKNSAYASLTQERMNELKRLYTVNELTTFFQAVPDSVGVFGWELKPQYADQFVQSLVTRLMTPTTNLEKTQQDISKGVLDIEIKESLSRNLKLIPWLQPLIQFLNLLKK